MPLWVTATSCNWDKGAKPTEEESCKRISGQAKKKFGQGSIHWFNQADNIARWAWFSLYNPATDPSNKNAQSKLVNIDNEVLPIGRAMLNGGHKKTDCAALPIL